MKKQNKVDLFLDSGAFSAWSQGVEIDIQEYISFIKEHEDIIEVYANLDDITSPQRTWDNQKIMEKAGLRPLPVFHYGEADEWLLRYLDAGYDYIALGGMVPISSDHLNTWLDRLFTKYLCSPNGVPHTKVHGFGLTSLPLLLRFPWYSVDSTSWVLTGRMGAVFVPRYRAGRWIHDENSWKIVVSNRSPAAKEAGKHISTLSPIEKEILLHYIHSKGYELGESSFRKETQAYSLKENERWAEKKPKDKTMRREVERIEIPGISNKYQLRDELNIIYFLDLEQELPEWPWRYSPSGMGGLGL